MAKQSDLGWLDKLALKNGSVLVGVLSVAIPLYARFIVMESKLKELTAAVEKLTVINASLRSEIAAEGRDIEIMSFKLQMLERQLPTPLAGRLEPYDEAHSRP